LLHSHGKCEILADARGRGKRSVASGSGVI
jgi:hypothetical protein